MLEGDLVLVASGDLTLAGRDLPDGTIAFTNFDHTEANSLGSAILTDTDPLAGLKSLARQVAAAGIKHVDGDIVVDDRLFDHFRVPNGNVLITPMVVNDNLVDVTITADRGRQAGARRLAAEKRGVHGHRRGRRRRRRASLPTSLSRFRQPTRHAASSRAKSRSTTSRRCRECRRSSRHSPLPTRPPMRAPPSSRRSTAAGVTVAAATGGPNASDRLPAAGSYRADAKVAELVSLPYSQYARLILKVSHNLGANLSLVLFGLTRDARTIETALAAERKALVEDYGLGPEDFLFPTNGSGSPDSQATPAG